MFKVIYPPPPTIALTFLFMLLVNVSFKIKAQSFACNSNYYCSIDFRDSLFTLSQTDSLTNISYAKSPQNSYYHDVQFSEDVADCVGRPLTLCTNISDALIFNAYFPKNTAYTHYNDCPLPVIFIYHPGGYSDCSSLDGTNLS